MTPIPPALLLDVNRLTVEVERLKKERDEWKDRYERVYDAGHNFSVIASVAESERDEAIRDRDDARRTVCVLQAQVLGNSPEVLATLRAEADSMWPGSGARLFPEKP